MNERKESKIPILNFLMIDRNLHLMPTSHHITHIHCEMFQLIILSKSVETENKLISKIFLLENDK